MFRICVVLTLLLGFPSSSARKNMPAVQEDLVRFLPIPVFLGIPGGSDGKESACNVVLTNL